jgi:hypothetical protein
MVSASYELDINVYGDPVIEFWKTDKILSTATISNLITSDFTTPFTSTDSFIYHDGDIFLNERSGYAPEELIAGTVLDSVGINVYTKDDKSYATVFSGACIVNADTTNTSLAISISEPDSSIIMVHYNGNVFTRVSNASNLSTSSTRQYYILENNIYIPPQPTSGILGYTAMSIGGDFSVLDSNVITYDNISTTTVTVTVESLVSIRDVRQAYVLLDGIEVDESGYSLTAVSGTNNRACVKVFNVQPGKHRIEAWFFESKYTKFNRIHEETIYSTSTQNTFTLSIAPGMEEPVSDKVIVTIDGIRLTPPWVSYYKAINNQRVFSIEDKGTYDPDVFNSTNTLVYVNGVELKYSFEYTINSNNGTVIIVNGLLRDGDVVAIMSLYIDNIYGRPNHEYVIVGNTLTLVTPVTINTAVKILQFTDHDNVMIRTENFDGSPFRRFTLDLPIRNDNYLWVYLNGRPLVSRYDFEILEDSRTIRISDTIDINNNDTVTITTINPPSYGIKILGFRMFKDMFGRDDYKRLSEFYTTSLTSQLTKNSTEIEVKDASRLVSPNPSINKPGVVLIDGERIEYFRKDGNTLRELRRGTLGTGRPDSSNVGTKVIDQSQYQILPDLEEVVLVQTTSTTATTYIISTITNSITGDGITFIDDADLVNQVSVYYGDRHLRKSSLAYHDSTIAYDPTVDSVSILPPEFTIDKLPPPVLVTVDVNGSTPSNGSGWVLPENSDTMQIQPGWIMQDASGARYTVIYSGHNTLFNGWGVGFANAITIAWPLTFTGPASYRLTLNVSDDNGIDTTIKIIQRKGQIWTGTNGVSLLSSTGSQALFMSDKMAVLPDIHYYGE